MLEDNKSYLNDLNDAQLSAVLKTDGPSMVIIQRVYGWVPFIQFLLKY